jgi:hypothetical protein
MKPNEITAQIVDAACRIHTQLGQRTSRRVAESAERAKGACAVWKPVDMAIPPKTARNLFLCNLLIRRLVRHGARRDSGSLGEGGRVLMVNPIKVNCV